MNLKWQAEFIADMKRNGHTHEAFVLSRRFLCQHGDWRNPSGKIDRNRLAILHRAKKEGTE